MSGVWKTKYGPRRVRHDPPTLEEAIAAARGLTDDVQAQIEIAASLMEMPIDQVRTAVLKSATPARQTQSRVAFTSRGGMQRSVIVERKAPRRLVGKSLGS